MMARTVFGPLLTLMFTFALAGCGGGDGDENGNTPDNGDDGPSGSCDNDSKCDSGENCANCTDCGCADDQTCSGSTCTGGGDDDNETCGDGTCTPSTDPALTEDCSTCPQDCGCGSGQVCRSWEALGLAQACGDIPDPTRYCGSVCGNPNSLIDAIPGRWRLIEPASTDRYDIVVDPSSPTCDIPGHEAGDACVLETGLAFMAVLDGTRMFLQSPPSEDFLEGQVLEEGRRLEYDKGAPEGPFDHHVWVKE